jgi:hypothetical protein
MVNHIRIHIPRSESNRAEHDQPQLDLPAACIIAQQYSSAAFSLHRKSARFDFYFFLVSYFEKKNIRKSETAKIETAEVGECLQCD